MLMKVLKKSDNQLPYRAYKSYNNARRSIIHQRGEWFRQVYIRKAACRALLSSIRQYIC